MARKPQAITQAPARACLSVDGERALGTGNLFSPSTGSNMLNIRTRAVAQTLTFELRDADDAPIVDDAGKPATVTVHGPGSRVFQTAQQRKGQQITDRMIKGKKISPEADARMQAEFLADITESIDVAYDELQGREKLLAIYGDRSIGFIADQVQAKIGDWGNFSKGSVKS